jgi:hypothetical protein
VNEKERMPRESLVVCHRDWPGAHPMAHPGTVVIPGTTKTIAVTMVDR